MSHLLADIDATCAALGLSDGQRYYADKEALPCLKHLIWILRRDVETHEYRRHLGRANILQTDLLPFLISYSTNEEIADVLLRLLINLTNPTLLLYREQVPKDVISRRHFVELVDVLQRYKEAFADQAIWTVLQERLHKMLLIEWNERLDDQNLLIERILVLIRNVLQVPANPDAERRSDNDASIHDQVLWSLYKSGIVDLVLYILASEGESQFQLHGLEILYLMYREQSATELANSALNRSESEKSRDAQELVRIRQYEMAKKKQKPLAARHSRFGGTFVMRNLKSISDQDMILHQALDRAVKMDFDKEKAKKRRSHFLAKEDHSSEVRRRSAFSVRLFLREYAIQVLDKAYNRFVKQARRLLETGSGGSEIGNDHSYLLWAIRFFMEFNRMKGFRLELVSETLSMNTFHYVLLRMQHDLDMISTDKKRSRLWAKRLNIGVKTFEELLLSLLQLQTGTSAVERALFGQLQNNVFYMLEYREMVIHLLINYNENHSTRSHLRDVVQMTNLFVKMLEKYSVGTVYVQTKEKKPRAKKQSLKAQKGKEEAEMTEAEKDELWQSLVAQLSAVLSLVEITLPEDESAPLPFDAASDTPIDDQKGDCLLRIHSLLAEEKFEHAVLLLRAAREVWPEERTFGDIDVAPEDELMLLQNIFKAKLGSKSGRGTKKAGRIHKSTKSGSSRSEGGGDEESTSTQLIDGDEANQQDAKANYDDGDANNDGDDDDDDRENDDDDEEEGEDACNYTERQFNFEDFAKRLVNAKVVRACTLALADWEHCSARALKSVVTILHRIAFVAKFPAMLYHAQLFRIFQAVLNAPPSKPHEELRRLAIYVIRQFTTQAEKNPKVFAELLFWKSARDCTDIENGYEVHQQDNGKQAWTEAQEVELLHLFNENQENPSNDNDVIDWLLENLIDKTRTRRGVMKKLREMGLHFKKPTKRMRKQPEEMWSPELDDQLRDLYSKYHEDANTMARIMDELKDESRKKREIIDRLVFLGCIRDKVEMAGQKGVVRRKAKTGDGKKIKDTSDDDDNDQFELAHRNDGSMYLKQKTKKKTAKEGGTKKQRKNAKKSMLNVATIKELVKELSGNEFSEALEWLKESLEDISEDLQDDDVDQEDAIPLVPILQAQRDAVDHVQFQSLLRHLGMQEPLEEMETYWRVPNGFKANDLQLRIQLLNGEDVELPANNAAEEDKEMEVDDDDVVQAPGDSGSSEEEEDENEGSMDRNKERDRINNNRNKLLLYNVVDEDDENDSSNDADIFEALKRRREQYLAKTMGNVDGPEQELKRQEPAKKKEKKAKNKQHQELLGENKENSVPASASEREQQESVVDDGVDTESLRLRLDDLIDSDDDDAAPVVDDDDNDDGGVALNKSTNNSQMLKRRKVAAIIDSDSEPEGTSETAMVEGAGKSQNINDSAKVSRKRERSDDDEGMDNKRGGKGGLEGEEMGTDEDDDGEKGNEGGMKNGNGDLKVKRKRIVLVDDDDDDE